MPPAKKTALKDEAVGTEEVTLRFEGHDYVIPGPTKWGLNAREAFEDGRPITLIRALLGAHQWALLKARHPDLSAEETTALEAAVLETLGAPVGESNS